MNQIYLFFFSHLCWFARVEEIEVDSGEDAVVTVPINPVTDTTAVSVEKLKSYIQQHSADSHFQDQFLVWRARNKSKHNFIIHFKIFFKSASFTANGISYKSICKPHSSFPALHLSVHFFKLIQDFADACVKEQKGNRLHGLLGKIRFNQKMISKTMTYDRFQVN